MKRKKTIDQYAKERRWIFSFDSKDEREDCFCCTSGHRLTVIAITILNNTYIAQPNSSKRENNNSI